MKKLILSVLTISTLLTSCVNRDDDNGGSTGGSSFVLNSADFKGTINDGTITLNPAETYQLTGALIVEDGASLVIPAGTTVEATGGTSAYIAVAQGGKIYVNGTSTNPVIMTSSANIPAPGDWGGLVICGKAPINKGATAQAEVSDLSYGGTTSNDNSGVVQYLRLEYTGATFNNSKEFNGLSLFGVGSGTTIDYVQLHQGNDDGIEFFGGTVTANHLIVTHPTDDAFDWTEGWTGSGTNWYAKLDNGRGHRGIEGDNLESDNTATPYSNPTITNVTIIGNGDGTEDDGFKIRRGTKGNFTNCILKGWNEGIEVDDAQTVSNLNDGSLKFQNIKFDGCTKAYDIDGTDYTTNTDAAAAYSGATLTEDTNTNGAGNNVSKPSWANGWTTGL